MRKHADLIAVMAIGIAACVAAAASGWLRVAGLGAAGVLMALLLPGYALHEALFAGQNNGKLERLALALGLSMTITTLAALVLSALRVNMRAETITVALLVITSILTGVAVVRRQRRTFVPVASVSQPQAFITPAQAFMLAGAAGIALVAFWVAALPTPPQGIQGYTALWIKPQAGAGNPALAPIEVGVISQEFGPSTFRVQLLADEKLAREWTDIRLESGETWLAQFDPAQDAPAANVLEVNLFKGDGREDVYRHVIFRRPATPTVTTTSTAP